MMMRTIDEVVAAFGCSGCGACAGVCPRAAIRLRRDAAGFLVAAVDKAACVACGQCLKACPGKDGSGGDDAQAISLEGYLGHAVSEDLRHRGQSGGVVSAIVDYLLKAELVDGVVLTRFNPSVRSAESFYARTVEEAHSAAGSCYCQSSVVATALEHRAERLAVVALGCQANAIARLRAQGMFASNPIVLGLVCAGNYSGDYIDRLSELAGVNPACVKQFRFRDKTRHGWPGEVAVSDGSQTVYLPAKTRARLKPTYGVPACLNCLDKLNASADVVFGDPWGFDDRDRKLGDSVVLVRTQRGAHLLREVEGAGFLSLEEVATEAIANGQQTDGIRSRMSHPWFARQRAFAQSIQAKTNRESVRILRLWSEGALPEKRRRILVYGFKLSENFGGPSVVHGFRAGLKRLLPEAQVVCYQPTPVDPVSVSDVDFPVLEYPYARRIRRFLKDWMRLKFLGKFPRDPACRCFWRDYRQADTVVNVHQFLPNLIARIDGKLPVCREGKDAHA